VFAEPRNRCGKKWQFAWNGLPAHRLKSDSPIQHRMAPRWRKSAGRIARYDALDDL